MAWTVKSTSCKPRIPALVSIHDVMPSTLDKVDTIVGTLKQYGIHTATLLVVPGTGWDARGIEELRALERAGYRLAGHGWEHRTARIHGLRHRLHSLFLSRNVAEHLALDRDGVLALMRRCRDWFEAQGLAPPGLYVPPAWALGAVSANDLRAAGLFRQVELFSGVLDVASGRVAPSPVLGYEADAAIRGPVLKLWNAWGRWRASALGRVRIGIHPRDLDLPLRAALEADLERFYHYTDYAAATDGADHGAGGGSHRLGENLR